MDWLIDWLIDLGILAVDIFARDTAKILTGGADKNATVFNKDLEQVRRREGRGIDPMMLSPNIH